LLEKLFLYFVDTSLVQTLFLQHGQRFRHSVQGPVRQEGDAHPHGRVRRGRKDDHPLQAQARRNRHHHPDNR